MSTKVYKGPQTQQWVDGSSILDENPLRIAVERTYPAIQQKNRLAVRVDPAKLYFYQCLRAGRRCSCHTLDSDPSSSCLNCFSKGIVGGYLKYGTNQILFDTTYPGIKSSGINIICTNEGPEAWGLVDDTVTGTISARVHFDGCWGPVDYLGFTEYRPAGTDIKWEFRPLGDFSWYVLNSTNLSRQLSQPQLFEIQATMSRPSINAESPIIVNAHIRIKRRPIVDSIVLADKPVAQKTFALSELGGLDEWTTLNLWMDDTLKNVTSDDWFYNLDDATHYKVVETKKLAPQGNLLSWDLTCRKVQTFETIAKYPI